MIYSRAQLAWAVNLSAVLGWICITYAVVGVSGITLWGFAAIIGLPIAFLGTWLIGAPILAIAMRREITWLRAMILGALIGMMLGASGALIESRTWPQSAEIIVFFIAISVGISTFVKWAIGEPNAQADD